MNNFQTAYPLIPLLEVAPLALERVQEFDGLRKYIATAGATVGEIIGGLDINFVERPSRADIEVKPKDVLFARMQATVKVLFADEQSSQYIFSTGFAVCRASKRILPKFLYYWFTSAEFNSAKDSLCTGATQKAISNSGIENLKIPLPPLAEQERIVRLLDETESLRRLRQQADARMASFILALFHEMFGHQTKWRKTKVEEVVEKRSNAIRTGPFGSELHHSEFITEGVPVLGIDNIVTNSFRWTRVRCLPLKKYDRFKRFRVFPNDIIITIMGTVGRVCVTPDDLPECMSTKHLCVISTDKNVVDPYYLWATFLFDQGLRKQTSVITKGAIMEGWNATIIRKLLISIPPIILQREFAAHVQNTYSVQAVQARSAERIEALYQSMLSRAFAGEL